MAKRKNRSGMFEHEMRQLEKLKELEPNITPEKLQGYSDALIDIALMALNEANMLEMGERPELRRIKPMMDAIIQMGEPFRAPDREGFFTRNWEDINDRVAEHFDKKFREKWNLKEDE
ncbi:MAG: hypothetical protein ACPG7F_00975 [Aggregatilineales bacterium]